MNSRRPVNSTVMFLTSVKAPNAAILIMLCSFTAPSGLAQKQGKDACHVYVVDIAKSNHAFETVPRTSNEDADEKALSVGQTIFPEFRPTIGEEELTTKHYSFPGCKIIITASVFYTDESMASHGHGEFVSHSDSMLIGVTVANRAKRSAIDARAGDNAIAEVTDDQYTNKVRAEKYVRVRGRLYLVGIECDCMADRRSK
jgi:hypothetical protein